MENDILKKTNAKIKKLSYPIDTKLTEKELSIYNTLKQWRADKVKIENVSSFVIAYETELIIIAKVRVDNIDDFKNIKGFVKKKNAKDGEDNIALLN